MGLNEFFVQAFVYFWTGKYCSISDQKISQGFESLRFFLRTATCDVVLSGESGRNLRPAPRTICVASFDTEQRAKTFLNHGQSIGSEVVIGNDLKFAFRYFEPAADF